MASNLLSPELIHKLGHTIAEIRIRALQSVLSKYNLELVDTSNFVNIKLLLDKLCDWFNYESHPHEEKVIQLIIKIFTQENSHKLVKEVDLNLFFKKIDKIEKCVDARHFSLLQELRGCITNLENQSLQHDSKSNSKYPVDSIERHAEEGMHDNHEQSQKYCESSRNSAMYSVDVKCAISNSEEDNEIILANNNPSIKLKSIHKQNKIDELCHQHMEPIAMYEPLLKIEYFPWQSLVVTDCNILSSLYEGLRYLDNSHSILQSCQFYIDIVLKDFPPEIFLQRPLMVQTFLELFQSEDRNIRLPVASCLISTVKHLKVSHYYSLDISFIQSKTELNQFTSFTAMSDNSSEKDKRMNLNLSPSGSDADYEEDVVGIKLHQYSVSQFCFSILSQTIPHLSKTKSPEEYNLILELILETFEFFSLGITPLFWRGKNEVRENLQKIMMLFNDAIVYHKRNSKIIHSIIVHIVIKILCCVKVPHEKLQELIPHCLQLELVQCASDYIFKFLFPNVHSKILCIMQTFIGQRVVEITQDYKTMEKLCKSLKSSVELLKSSTKATCKLERLNLIANALPSIEYHRNFQVIRDFVMKCLLKWPEHHLETDEIALRKNILLKLLSHGDEGVKTEIYKDINSYAVKYLGVEEAQKPRFEYPGNKFAFLFDSDVLAEMICHGLNSSQNEIRHFATEIFIHIIKGKFMFSKDFWEMFIKALVPCLPLLECFADKSSALGRCVMKMLDPDISKTISMPPLELVRGNLRLLFSKDHLIREEAMSRLFWLLTREDKDKKKLPQLNLLRGINLSSICSSVTPEEYSRMNQFYNVGSLCNVMEMLAAEGVEPSVRRSALTQISVMLEDSHLHSTFLDQNGLNIILAIFENCLIEQEFQNYPDSVIPILNILKTLCIHNPSIRLHLSQDYGLYFSILRGLLLFNGHRNSRQNGVELLCLLLYNECIISVQNETAIMCKISFPEVVVKKICLPFLTHIHWKCSRFSEQSERGLIMMKEKLSQLLRVYWNIEWFGGIEQVLSLEREAENKISSPSLPSDMILKSEDIISLKNCAITYGIQKTLFDIQNATTHESVIFSIHNLNSYIMLYEIERDIDEGGDSREIKDLTLSIMKMPWETTFERFLLLTPCCEEDEIILYQVVRTVRIVLRLFKTESLLGWMEKLLTNEFETLPNVVKSYGKQRCGLMRRYVTRDIIELIKETITQTSSLPKSSWLFYVDVVIRNLELEGIPEYYDEVHVDWLMSVLVHVTGQTKGEIAERTKLCEEAITKIMEVIIVVHCSKGSEKSFLGTSIIKNCLKVLNHMLMDMQATTKGWEQLWHQALSQVTGHREQANYCWLISLWFNRDLVIRGLAIQLVTGFCVTCRACDLLIEQLHIEFLYIWNEGFRLIFDDEECNLVREKAALLLANLTTHGSVITASDFLQNLSGINFFERVQAIFERLRLEPKLSDVIDSTIFQVYGAHCRDTSSLLPLTTPSLIDALCKLLLNIIFLNPVKVGDIMMKTNLLESLTKLFLDGPEVCEKYKMESHIFDVMKMYISASKLISKCISAKPGAYLFVQQSQQFINSIYALLNYNLFNDSPDDINQRNMLWCEIFDLLSILLNEPEELLCERGDEQSGGGFRALNHSMTENGIDYFISSIYLAATSNLSDLRFSCFQFLSNLFSHEARKSDCTSISDIMARKIFSESVGQAEIHCWKGFNISKELDLNFAERICDVLLQSYSFYNSAEKSEFKACVSETLGSLFVICETAQTFAISQGLADDIAASLRTSTVKLSMETVESLRKAADRKMVDQVLLEVESSYRLLTDVFNGNEKIKAYVANLGLSSLVHKLWHWCTVRNSFMMTTLKMLSSFTLNSGPACRSLLLSRWNVVGLRKSTGSASLLACVMQLVEEEMDQISRCNKPEIIRLSLQILENCCIVLECRSAITKGTFIVSFNNVYDGLKKKRVHNEDIVQIWYNFLIILTAYEEGQLTLTKNQGMLDTIIYSASSMKTSQRIQALKIIRNISCHKLNRPHLLSLYQFLSVISQSLKSDETEEMSSALLTLWALTYNSQKGKVIIRNSGFEELLMEAKNRIKLTSSLALLSEIDNILEILRNK